MMFYLITVLLGTIYPIFTDVLTGNKISIGPPFYNIVIITSCSYISFNNGDWPKSKMDKRKI